MQIYFLENMYVRVWFTRVFLFIVFLSIGIRQALTTHGGGSSYQTADWLINYSGGFVRRGLFGEIFSNLPVSGPSGLWLLFVIQLNLYISLLVFGYFMIKRSKFSWLAILVWLGPGALGFFAWDTGSPFRKEILGFLVLACLTATRGNLAKPYRTSLTTLSILGFALAMFSWEPSALFLPVIFYLIWTNPNWVGRQLLYKKILILVFLGIGVIGALFSVLYHGTAQTSAIICESLRLKDFNSPQMCSGAIDAIGWSSAYALEKVQNSFPLYWGYLFLAILAIVPSIFALKEVRSKIWIVIILVGFVPLFILVNDYGRWINMAAISLAFVTATLTKMPEIRSPFFPLLSILYLVLWGIPHTLDPVANEWPWLGLLATILEQGSERIW